MTGRPLEWATRTVTEGEVLAAFAAYSREELDEVDVVEEAPERLVLAWRRERAALRIRSDEGDVVAQEIPELLLAALTDVLVARFLDDTALRARVAVYDLARLEKVNAVRSSLFVYFEWFLRDEYGVKLLPAAAFTQGLVDRGIISLGMG